MPAGLRRLVATMAVGAVVAQLVVALATRNSDSVTYLATRLHWAHGLTLLVVLLALTVIGDLVSVRVRHGEESEELTLFEAAVVVDVLLLPPSHALLVPVLASILCSVVRRRELVKTVFNAANQAVATALLVGVVHALCGSVTALSFRAVAAL